MRGEVKDIFRVACVYMATIIGAGFASGQEIVKFFSTYYRGGFYGIIVAGILFSIIGYVVLDKVYTERIKNYDELVFPMVGWTFGWIMEVIVTLFMLCLFCVMVAGMGNIVAVEFNIPFNRAIVIIAAICMAAMLTDMKGIVTINTVITPVLIIGILATGIYIIVFKDMSVVNFSGYFSGISNNWLLSAVTYVSYNSIMSMVVMSSLLPYLKSRKVGIAGGILGGLMLCIMAFLINTVLFLFYPDVLTKELPMLDIVKEHNRGLSGGYTLVLGLAMFISAVTAGYYFIERISGRIKINMKILTVIVCILVIPAAGFGFSNLISTIYPIFGYAGMFMVFAVLLQGVKLRPLKQYAKSKKKDCINRTQ